MPSLAAVREARILALEAELSTLRGDSRPAFRYDHSTPLKDPYAHTGVRPWGGWRSGWKSPTRPRVRFGIPWSVRENIEPAAVERSGRCEPSGRHASRGVGETMSEPTHEAPALIERDGERDHIEPVSPDEARQYYEDLPEHDMPYAEAFGDEAPEA